MKHSWLALLVVVVLGLLAGAAIAGRPRLPHNDIQIGTAAVSTTSVSTTVVPTTDKSGATSSSVAPESTAPVHTVAATTTTAVVTTTTAPAASTTTLPASPDRAAVRLVVANATDRSGIAGDTARRLRTIGYTQVRNTDALVPLAETAVFARPGFEAAGEQVAADLGFGPERVQALADTAITSIDAAGDVIVALGADGPG